MSQQTTTIRRDMPIGRLSRIGAAIAGTIAAIALSISGAGVANADTVVDPSGYLVGDTVYFSYSNWASCAMHPNGWVGCDMSGRTMNWVGLQVSNISIDLSFLPAHPAIGPLGTHGQAGSRQLAGTSAPDSSSNASITYGGATCVTSNFRGEVSCTSQGHSFNFGFSQGYN
jgi:hypothetical protein